MTDISHVETKYVNRKRNPTDVPVIVAQIGIREPWTLNPSVLDTIMAQQNQHPYCAPIASSPAGAQQFSCNSGYSIALRSSREHVTRAVFGTRTPEPRKLPHHWSRVTKPSPPWFSSPVTGPGIEDPTCVLFLSVVTLANDRMRI